MKTAMTRMLCKLLIVMMAWVPFHATQAGMIGTGEQFAVSSAQAERSAVLSFINRADVARELQTRGVDLASAQERIAALTDQEVRSLAGALDSAPAGAGPGWVVVLILVGVIAWLVWKK